MSIFSSRPGLILALISAAVTLGERTAHAQASPVTSGMPSWVTGFGGNSAPGQMNFDGGAQGPGFSATRYNFSNGWFVGSEGGGVGFGTGFGMNSITQNSAFGSSLSYQGAQFGYKFQNSPITVYTGLNTLKYNTGIGSPFAPFDSTSGTLPVYNMHAGIEFKPTSNVSLAIGANFTQQSGRIDSDINSPSLLGAPPFAFGARH